MLLAVVVEASRSSRELRVKAALAASKAAAARLQAGFLGTPPHRWNRKEVIRTMAAKKKATKKKAAKKKATKKKK